MVVVVTRWFGAQLGVGGLVQAYGGCANKALDRAAVVETGGPSPTGWRTPTQTRARSRRFSRSRA